MARVAVIGGGYGGVTVAKGLDPLADVILIEQKDQFVHHAAALRAAVDTVWEHAIFMPYTNLLHRGEVVRGTVSRVDGTTVHVFGHDPIDLSFPREVLLLPLVRGQGPPRAAAREPRPRPLGHDCWRRHRRH